MFKEEQTDLEAGSPVVVGQKPVDVSKTERDLDTGSTRGPNLMDRIKSVLIVGNVELRGVMPVPIEERTSTKYFNYFTIWACMNVNLLPLTFGMLGPEYGLSLRDSTLVIIFFCLLTAAFPAFLGTIGPKTGLRQMIQARYSFGRYLVCVPVALNLATMIGFCVMSAVMGGQCLSAVSDGHLSQDVGIVIVGLCALIISFCGYRVMHAYEQYAWIPALIAIIIATGCGGSGLKNQTPAAPATASGVLSFAMIIASYMIPYSTLASDLTTYLNPKISSFKLFLYGFAGLCLPTIPLMILGAAIGNAVANNPSWQEGYNSTAMGGVLAAMLHPAAGFGKFVVVVLSLTILGNMSATMYSITLNFQILVPQFVVVPRFIFSIVVTAILIPLGIRAAVDFFESLEDFLSLIGYWSAAFVAVLLIEHFVFRKRRFETYKQSIWNSAADLPWGIAALSASALSFALVIPSMAEVWYTGPIAKTTGDLGFEFALVVTAVLYLPFRYLEKKWSGR